ncbi:glutamate--tRNA ligase family protein [Polynucleobacter necessarius]|uniref:glutamate--tRNA ligase family protein n=1 Tax=Polynucleobacter necessarius TaxID=576610 RepID=UPI0022B26423|nr:glutamate--tRNA ligase family protein [Polynucleobacter necessarius]
MNESKSLYPCICSRQTIANTLANLGIDAPRNQEMVYPGTCRPATLTKNPPEILRDTKKAWRIALPKNCHIEFEYLALGPQSQNLNTEVGDFVLRRSDGLFTYQLAVVVDDAEQGITHIVRGQDLLSNTARQMYLQEALGYPRPEYLHLPLVLDEHGEKLSKQTLATQINTQDEKHALMELRKATKHLGLNNLPYGENVTMTEWLLAATHTWKI